VRAVHAILATCPPATTRLSKSPVVTHKTLQDSGNCPVTGQPLKLEELVPLQTNAGVKVRTTTTASLPGLLSSFQVFPACTRDPTRTRAPHRPPPARSDESMFARVSVSHAVPCAGRMECDGARVL